MANNSSRSAADVLDGLKSRLGFGHKDDDDFYDDDFDDYEDDYEDDNFDDEPGGYQPLSSRSSHTSRFGRADSAASNLVSIDDVRAHTRASSRDAYDAGSSYTTYANPAPSRSEGYDSLFEPTETPTFTPYDPNAAYASASAGSSYTTRPLTVIKPVVYGDVERVARAVKSGDVVVLVMRNTPDDLSKRILDFSFGVASALDANVECPGDKVFAIARGAALTEDEKTRLRNQGAL